MEIEQIKNTVLGLPEAIKQKQIQILDEERLLAENKLIFNTAKLNTTRDVTEEKLDGKPKFSNKEKRDVEIEKRMAENYANVSECIESQKKAVQDLSVELDFLKYKLRSMEVISRLGL